MSTIVVDRQSVHVPEPFEDLEAFRSWARSEAYPDAARICYLNGEVWVDMSKEQFTHNQIKGEMTSVLTRLVKRERRGRFFPDGYLLSNPRANLSTNPDGIFVSEERLRSGRVQLVEGVDQGLVELQGTPDMVLEIISPSSVEKDTVVLPDLYWRAGIPEYWLVDPQTETVEFTIFRRTAKAYVRQRKAEGWVRSSIFGRSFRLSQQADALGYPEYTLAMR
jgi:Uma2 family endonuclease